MRNKVKLFTLTEKDFIVQAKRGSGKGGQKKNKTSSAIQIFHEPSGAMGEAEDHRQQSQNRKLAFKRLTDSTKFKAWLQLKIDAACDNVDIEEADDKGVMQKRKLRHEEV